jgi:hypothetical protein
MESALNHDINDIILPPSSFKIILLTVLRLQVMQQMKTEPITVRKLSRDAQRSSSWCVTQHLPDTNFCHNDLALKYAVSGKLYLVVHIYFQNSLSI